MCGESTGQHKQYIAALNRVYTGRLHAQQVPCYPGYLQINCLAAVSRQALDSINVSANKAGWVEVLVYDPRNRLLHGSTISM